MKLHYIEVPLSQKRNNGTVHRDGSRKLRKGWPGHLPTCKLYRYFLFFWEYTLFTRRLCTRSRIYGIKAMSRGISGGKQVVKFANTSNRGRVCLFCQKETTIHSHAKCRHWVLAKFKSLLFAMRTFYARYCIQKSNNDSFHPYFDIFVFKIKRSSFPVV